MNQENGIGRVPIDNQDEWIIERRQVNASIEEFGPDVLPDVIVCLSVTTELVLGACVIHPNAQPEDVLSAVKECMLNPLAGDPHRPGMAHLVGNLESLRFPLEASGIRVSTGMPSHPLMDEVIAELEKSLTSGDMLPYLIGDLQDAELVADFFRAAADFHKIRPWQFFEREIPIRVTLLLEDETAYWAVVVGVGQQEYGVCLYRSVEDLLKVYATEHDEEAYQAAMKTWTMGFSYEEFDSLGAPAQEECLMNNWPMLDLYAYPSAIILDPESPHHIRPNEQELAHLTAVTRALTKFIDDMDLEIEDEDVIEEYEVEIDLTDGPLDVILDFPAPELLDEDEEENGF